MNPNLRQFSWFKPNGNSESRIDYWLTSNSLIDFIEDISISAAPLMDHCCISISFYSGKRRITLQRLLEIQCRFIKTKTSACKLNP